jgi:hypothetical protein
VITVYVRCPKLDVRIPTLESSGFGRHNAVKVQSPGITPLWRSLRPCELILKVFLPPSNRSKDITSNDTENGGQKLPDGDDNGDPRQNELDELICLIQVVLAGDVVLDISLILRIFLGRQV